MVLAGDIGTSSLKLALIDPQGKQLWYGRISYIQLSPPQQGPERWWQAWQQLIATMDPRLKTEVRAIVFSGNGPTMVPSPTQETQQRPSSGLDGIYIDWQTPDLAMEATRSYFLPKIHSWLAQSGAGTRGRMPIQLSTCPDYLLERMGARHHCAIPHRGYEEFYWTDGDRVWATGRGVQLPPLVEGGTDQGELKNQLAEGWGFSKGVRLVAGGSDFALCVLGTDTSSSGQTCDRAGTSEGLNHSSTQAISSPQIRSLPHPKRGLFNHASILLNSGALFEWARTLTGTRAIPYAKLMKAILERPLDINQPFFFPSGGGPGSKSFEHGHFASLGPSHDHVDLARSIILAIGFSIRRGVDTLRGAGAQVEELRLSGGQSRNELWNQMKADITGLPIRVFEVADGELLGAAALAYSKTHPWEAAAAMVKTRQVYEPQNRRTKIYDELFDSYCSRWARLAELDP